ncbi:MAG TPA: exosortase [Lacipirellulaceae bacterium]|nr:exosortase [Lacipirellulaceae bacterium]
MSTAARTLSSRGFALQDDFDEARLLGPAETRTAWIVFGVLAAAVTLAYGNMLSFTSSFWVKDEYSHGWIVPLIAAYLFWVRMKPLTEAASLDRWIGVTLIGVCLLVRVWSAYFDINLPDRLSYIGALLGVTLVAGGRNMLLWAGPAIAFAVFMYPLPQFIENTLLMKLQTYATMISTWVMQALGVSAAREGNTIAIDNLETPLQVVEACSGLRMLTIFGAMSVALVMIIERPWWDKLIILLSAIPIALISNVVRIVSIGLLQMVFGQDTLWLDKLIHDWAGLAMMPIGLGLLWLELSILSRLTVPIEDDDFGAGHVGAAAPA